MRRERGVSASPYKAMIKEEILFAKVSDMNRMGNEHRINGALPTLFPERLPELSAHGLFPSEEYYACRLEVGGRCC